MSRLDTQFAASGLPMLFEQLGRSGIVYTPDGGTPVTLTAIVGAEVITIEEEPQGKTRVRRREMKITRDPTSSFGGVANPWPRDTVTIDGVAWSIEDEEDIDRSAAVAVLPLVRFEPIAKGNYRFRD